MPKRKMSYGEARAHMQPGDVVAFSGRGRFAALIKFATQSDVSHVGVVLRTEILDNDGERYFNLVVESTGANGVATVRFSDLIRDYEGDIWWLPLDDELRSARFNEAAFFDFLFNQTRRRKDYDLPQALRSALDSLDEVGTGRTRNQEDFEKFFCSELVAAALEKSGLIGKVNASEVTPIELCRWRIYNGDYVLLKGSSRKRIDSFNSIDPGARFVPKVELSRERR